MIILIFLLHVFTAWLLLVLTILDDGVVAKQGMQFAFVYMS